MTPLPSLKELRVDGNDISMVAKNAFIGANDLENLSLHDNPLSCDCSLKPFAEWLSTSSISSQVKLFKIDFPLFRTFINVTCISHVPND